MTRHYIHLVVLLGLMGSSVATAQGPFTPEANSGDGSARFSTEGAGELFTQCTNPFSSAAFPSLNHPAGTVRAADDFVVPAPDMAWDVTSVTIAGRSPNPGGIADYEVVFYANSGGLPGAVECSYPSVSGPISDTYEPIELVLPSSCTLTAGVWWVAVMANSAGPLFFWADSAAGGGSPFAVEDPDDVSTATCTSWGSGDTCWPECEELDCSGHLCFRIRSATQP